MEWRLLLAASPASRNCYYQKNAAEHSPRSLRATPPSSTLLAWPGQPTDDPYYYCATGYSSRVGQWGLHWRLAPGAWRSGPRLLGVQETRHAPRGTRRSGRAVPRLDGRGDRNRSSGNRPLQSSAAPGPVRSVRGRGWVGSAVLESHARDAMLQAAGCRLRQM